MTEYEALAITESFYQLGVKLRLRYERLMFMALLGVTFEGDCQDLVEGRVG